MNAMQEERTRIIQFRPSEQEILYLVSQCYTNKEIAEILGIRYGTVRNVISDIMRLLGIHERLHLVRYTQALEFGIKKSPHRITEALNPSMLKTQKTEVGHTVAEI